mmetsp:Transcript_5557/g.23605  ORF Transcript_5557/g.23605 Transcript_5557/m.23605 type:complete len:264 (-) Transcript_5557:1912-2703(-)
MFWMLSSCGFLNFSGVKEVSYGSSIKLAHKETGYRLHSHDVKYGSGSRENSVTGNRFAHDPNSLWLVKPKLGAPVLEQGTPVKCGDTIRLEHVATGCNLHTHKVRSPLSSQWEVCADGYRDDASDPGDNFNVVCELPSINSELALCNLAESQVTLSPPLSLLRNVWRDLIIGCVVSRSDSNIPRPGCILDLPQSMRMELQSRVSWRYFLLGKRRKVPFGIRRRDFTSLCITEGVEVKSKFHNSIKQLRRGRVLLSCPFRVDIL